MMAAANPLFIVRIQMLLITGLILFCMLPAYGSNRALLVGVSNYEHLQDLESVSQALESLKEALKTRGFEVEILEDPTLNMFRDKVREFIKTEADHSVLFFTGRAYDELRSSRNEVSYLYLADADKRTKPAASGYMMLDELVDMLVGDERMADMWVFIDGLAGKRTTKDRVNCGVENQSDRVTPIGSVLDRAWLSLAVATLTRREHSLKKGNALASKLTDALVSIETNDQLCQKDVFHHIKLKSDKDNDVGLFGYWHCGHLCLPSNVEPHRRQLP